MQHHNLPPSEIQYDDGTSYDAFFREVPLPDEVNKALPEVQKFVSHAQEAGKRLIVITSGGTIVPLEHNMVRYLDNFSGGGRGAASAEYFIEKGYAVLFLYRKNSLLPYVRHCMQHGTNFFEFLHVGSEGQAEITPSHIDEINRWFLKYSEAQKDRMLFRLPFLSVGEYLYLLRAIAKISSPMGPNVLIYSAGAISDFYIPLRHMALHKIQSTGGGIELSLSPVPKMLKPLVDTWSPRAFVVSFKLETEDAILESKSKGALQSYHHQLVIGNMLSSYREKVIFYVPEKEEGQTILRGDLPDIEITIVDELIKHHSKYIEKANEKK